MLSCQRVPTGQPGQLPIKAVLFDFDGTLWDCEPHVFQAYREVFLEFQQQLPVKLWSSAIGTIGFDLWTHLERLTGASIDRGLIEARVQRRKAELLSRLHPRPGVRRYLNEVDALGMVRGIVSNSSRDWIATYARHCGIGDGWRVVKSADGDLTRAKPRPDLYASALDSINVRPEEAVAFEDSPSGIRAAKQAGIRCVAVSNGMTAARDLGDADIRITSFEHRSLLHLIEALAALPQRGPPQGAWPAIAPSR
jgi:HAD superfamily hydrolase (TIGR01509 family)